MQRALFCCAGQRAETLERAIVSEAHAVHFSAWAKVHPGSEGAIKAHLGEDITELWDALLHPRYALDIIFALQVGWVV